MRNCLMSSFGKNVQSEDILPSEDLGAVRGAETAPAKVLHSRLKLRLWWISSNSFLPVHCACVCVCVCVCVS